MQEITEIKTISGKIKIYDPSEFYKDYIKTITNIASLSFGNEESKKPENLFGRLLKESAGKPSAIFEFMPILLDYNQVKSINFESNIIKYGEEANGYWLTNLRAIYNDNYAGLKQFMPIAKNISETEYNQVINDNFFVFRVETDIVTLRQLMRHRGFSFNEISRRRAKKELTIYQEDLGDLDLENMVSKHNLNSLMLYDRLVENGISLEKARRVLPLSLKSDVWVASPLKAFKNFLDLRMDKHTQTELRDIACRLFDYYSGY